MSGGNQIHVALVDPAGGLVGTRTGRLKVLAVAARERSSLLPDAPTVAESGFPAFEALGWFGYFAPAGTPTDIVTRLSTETQAALQQPDVKEKILNTANEPLALPAPAFSAFIQAEAARWSKVVRQVGVRID
jgi:tripartite-type tricarboxylate transporter receptor subunit TctC